MTSYMAQKLPVRCALRWAWRFPIWLSRAHLGHQFLLLTHRGRTSGLPRQTVLEVVRDDPATRTHVVAAGWRVTSDWYRNFQQQPDVVMESGRWRPGPRFSRRQKRQASYAPMSSTIPTGHANSRA